jgi:hypothetical protein
MTRSAQTAQQRLSVFLGTGRTEGHTTGDGPAKPVRSSDDRTWTWLGRQVMGSDWHRCTSVLSGDGHTMRATHERSNDGDTWIPWMEVTLRRER